MALTRKDIRAKLGEEANVTDAQITELLNLFHGEVDAVRDERDNLKNQLAAAEKERDTAMGEKEKAQKDLTDYQAQQANRETRATKEAAYKQLLQNAGISEKRIPAILKVTDFDAVELNKDGAIRNADKLTEAVKEDYAGFIEKVSVQGAAVSNPPEGGATDGMTKAEIMKIKDAGERQAAIASHIELFQ